MSALAIRLKEAMDDAGINQSELARRASTDRVPVKQQNIQNILSGRDKKSKHTAALARVLGINFEWLAEGRGPKRIGDERMDAPPGKSTNLASAPRTVTFPVELPSELQLMAMFASMLEMAEQPDPKGELAQKLAQSFPGALKRTLIAFSRARLAAMNVPDVTVQPRAKHHVERQQRART